MGQPTANPESNDANQPLSNALGDNLTQLRADFGNSPDLVIRDYDLTSFPIQVAAIYIAGITGKKAIESFVGHALSLEAPSEGPSNQAAGKFVFDYMKEKAISLGKEMIIRDRKGLHEALLGGYTVFLIDGLDRAVGGDTGSVEGRAVSEPSTQVTIRGSKEAFTESIQTNIALVRKRIKNPALWVESMKIGTATRTDVSILYMHGVAEETLIRKIKDKLGQIRTDSILESGYVEQFMEENKFSPFPTWYNSERPDSVAAHVLDGRVAIFVDGTPFVLIAPTTFFMFFHTVEDYYQRYDISSLIRLLRLICLFISLFGPALFIAALNFHQEMIPTPLLISLASQREGVPFPTFIEALLMEITFEVIREAGIRLPSPIGQTVSIIGGLVLGQAAVQAGIVSPAMIIVVALTGISSFATPAFNMALSVRMLRFAIMFAAAFLGLYGIAIVSLMLTAHLCSLHSLGTPYMSPLAPFKAKGHTDALIRSHQALKKMPSKK